MTRRTLAQALVVSPDVPPFEPFDSSSRFWISWNWLWTVRW